MNCPRCGAWSSVLATRTTATGVRRRRACANEHRFTTVEIVQTRPRAGLFSKLIAKVKPC